MAKWRVKKSRSSEDWLYPWTTVSPSGMYLDWSSWHKSMEHVNNELRRCKTIEDESERIIRGLIENVNRLTVVGAGGRVLEAWNIYIDDVALQDDGQTLKIFYREGQGNE